MAFPLVPFLFLCFAISCCCAVENDDMAVKDDLTSRLPKFFVPFVTKTVTSTVFSSSVVQTIVFPSCFSSLQFITACTVRRRRWLLYNEEPIFLHIQPGGLIQPSPVNPIQATSLPLLQFRTLTGSMAALDSSNSELNDSSQAAVARFIAGTIFTTVTVTSPSIVLQTSTGRQTATISLANCKPIGVTFSPVCPV